MDASGGFSPDLSFDRAVLLNCDDKSQLWLPEVADPGDQFERERGLRGLGRVERQRGGADPVDIGTVDRPHQVDRQGRTWNPCRYVVEDLQRLVAADAQRRG
jgi:hypothetical protein